MNRAIIILLLVVVIFVGAFVLGRQSVKPEQTVSSQLILAKVQDQSFLVTKTLFFDETVSITLADSKGWKGFFVGDELRGRGTVRIDLGVDLKSLNVSDIVVDASNKSITVYLPKPEILDSSLFGELDVQSKKGVWSNIRDFFTDHENTEYNRVIEELVNSAESAALEQTQVFEAARNGTHELVRMLVHYLAPEYRIEILEK